MLKAGLCTDSKASKLVQMNRTSDKKKNPSIQVVKVSSANDRNCSRTQKKSCEMKRWRDGTISLHSFVSHLSRKKSTVATRLSRDWPIRSFSSYPDGEIRRLLDVPRGSLTLSDTDEIHYLLQQYRRHGSGEKWGFELIDRLVEESRSTENVEELSYQSVHNECRSALHHWKKQNTEEGNSDLMIDTATIIDIVRDWNLNVNFPIDAKVYGMIADVAGQKENEEDVQLCESFLDWMLKTHQSNQRVGVSPNGICFGSLMKTWIACESPEMVEKVEGLLNRLAELHDQGWPDMKPTIIHYNVLLHAMATCKLVDRAERTLQSMLQNDKIPEPDQISFSTLLLAYKNQATLESMESANTLLEQMLELYEGGMVSAKPTLVGFTTVMKGYAQLGLPDQVETLQAKLESLYQSSLDSDWEPDSMFYNMVIEAHCRGGHPERASELVQEFIEHPSKDIDEMTFHALLSGWAESGNIDGAENTLNFMHEAFTNGSVDVRPTTRSYNLVLNAYARSRRKDAWKRARDILLHMETLYNEGDELLRPTTESWNSVLNCFGFSGKGDFHHAFKVLDSFLEAAREGRVDGSPNVRTWNTLLAGCRRNTTDDYRVRQIWDMMEEHETKADIVTYNTIISCYANYALQNGDFEASIESIAQSLYQRKDLKFTTPTFRALVDAWIAVGRMDRAEGVLKDMCSTEEGTQPDRETFHRVLRAWLQQNNARRVESLVLLMQELYEKYAFDSLKPGVDAYNLLLQAWATSGEKIAGERADLVLREMLSKDVPINLAAYNNALNAWASSRDPVATIRMESLVLEMILSGKANLEPNDVTYRIWLKGIRSSKQNDKKRRVQEVLKTMKIHKFEPSQETLAALDYAVQEVNLNGVRVRS